MERHREHERQTETHAARLGPATEPVLITDRQAQALLQVGSRTFAELIATASWLPAPVSLGPRLRRWVRSELVAAIARMPRPDRQSEPAQLLKARIAKMKAVGQSVQA